MIRNRRTVADLRALKGKSQLTMLCVATTDEASAAEEAGIDILGIDDPVWTPAMRAAAPHCFVSVGHFPGAVSTYEDYLRHAHRVMAIGGDCVYCDGSNETIARLRGEGVPVCGHVGLIPSKCTWTGGFRAVGKTAVSALEVYRQVKELESAGAVAAEMEVVPERVAAEISKRTSLLLWSMGSGSGCDAQYLYAEDVLGLTRDHLPRHAKVYRDFRGEMARLQRERVAAFSEFSVDVAGGAFPSAGHTVPIADAEFAEFLARLY